MAVGHPLCHAVLGVYIPWICLISIVRRRSRRCCPCPFLPRPAPPSIPQIHADLPRFRSRRGYPAAGFGRCSRSHLDLMLRDSAVVGEFFPPAQVAPPKKYLPQLSPVRRRNGVLSVFCRLCFLSLRILPFLSKIENAAACQTFQPVCVCMMSCI